MTKNKQQAGFVFDGIQREVDAPPFMETQPLMTHVPGSASNPPTAATSTAPAAHAPEMDQMALVFLDDPIARRLAVAWIACKGDERRWFECAGMAKTSDADRVAKALRINGVCRDGGVTDKLAMDYIKAIVAKPLSGAIKKGGSK